MEVGPWRVDRKGGLRFAQGGWEEYATVVFGALFCYPEVSPLRLSYFRAQSINPPGLDFPTLPQISSTMNFLR